MADVKDPSDLQRRNRIIVQEQLEQAYVAVDVLIRKSYSRHDMEATSLLRDLRGNINSLLPEIRSSGLDTFHRKKGTLDDLYCAEDSFISSSEKFNEAVNSSAELEKEIDVLSLQQLLTTLQRNFRERIPVSNDIIREFKVKSGIDVFTEPFKETSSTLGAFGIRKTGEIDRNSVSSASSTAGAFGIRREGSNGKSPSGLSMGIHMGSSASMMIEPDGRELTPHLLADLYNYFNILEQKYSVNHPEISATDVYIGDRKWDFEKGDRYLKGNIYDNLFSRTLIFYTVFKPFDDLKQITECVQKEADKVPSGQYLSLCLIGVEWPEDMMEWTASFFHLRMSLFIYDIGTGTFCFNKDLKLSNRFAFWHNMDKETPKLYDRLLLLLKEAGSISIAEAAKQLELEEKSTAEYFKKLLKNGVLVDVGVGEHRYALVRSVSKEE